MCSWMTKPTQWAARNHIYYVNFKGVQVLEMYKIWNLCNFAQVSYFVHFRLYFRAYATVTLAFKWVYDVQITLSETLRLHHTDSLAMWPLQGDCVIIIQIHRQCSLYDYVSLCTMTNSEKSQAHRHIGDRLHNPNMGTKGWLWGQLSFKIVILAKQWS